MDIDPNQPWGIAIDYYGRATVTEGGHTVQIRIYDQTMGNPLTPDPFSGDYPAVYISTSINERGDGDALLQGFGDLMVYPDGPAPVVPNQTAVPDTVAAAVADFETRAAHYAALLALWPAPTPAAAQATTSPTA